MPVKKRCGDRAGERGRDGIRGRDRGTDVEDYEGPNVIY